MTELRVALEVGSRRVFASAIDWPGWSRTARNEEGAVEALLAYAPRFGPVVERAGFTLPRRLSPNVVERLPGSATTEFGAPDAIAEAEREPYDAKAAKRLAAFLEASWAVFDEVVADAPEQLRKGPRGGGRDRDAIVDHVDGAEHSYSRKIGIPGPETKERGHRREVLVAHVAASSGLPVHGEKGWPVPYFVRRVAWHVLDHAWEIEDKSD